MPTAVLSDATVRARLGALTRSDARRLERRWRDVRRGDDAARAAFAEELERAEEKVAQRIASVPSFTIPESLPIAARAEELVAAIRDHRVVVVAGETGSGKSTQLPKLCLRAGRGIRGMIGHTQPRRLAARTVAERIAEEMGVEVGGLVGYTYRFTDRVADSTLVKVMTDGILLAEIQRDRWLSRYDTIIVDEAHERSLNIDFLLGYLHRLLERRDDLTVIITSATIDTERFARHFGNAPVVTVSGRSYPVEVRYRPYGEDPDDDRDQIQAVVDAVDELRAEGPGDVLVFLSGEREIHDTADAIRRLRWPDTEVLPLYARLSSAEQHRIFQPHRGRRIVLSTNVAETSLTVPGIRYVVDAGTARISRYSRRLKVQRLPIEPVSRASADQRAGRCGRVAPGVCIRLYSEEDYARRPEYTEPEILRTNLASVILQMTALGLGEVAGFPFVDPPDPRSVKDGVALLEELGALDPTATDGRRRLTPLGRQLAQLPIDPRLGRMVLESARQGCVREVLILAAVLSIQDPRERPSDAPQAADALHRRFADEQSDFLSLLNLWRYLREQQQALSTSQFRKLCRSEHINYLRVREWQDLYSQLRQVASTLGIRAGTEPAAPDAIHRSLLAGLLSHVGVRSGDTAEFQGPRGARFVLGAGSVLARRPPRWVMVAELVETNRLWGRVAARIQPQWIESLAGPLLRRSYADERWDRRRGSAVVTERVTLFGLPIVAGRTVALERVDRAAARELFIWHALVDGDWDHRHEFVGRNRERMDEIRALEDRIRRRDLLIGDDQLYALYDARLPAEIASAAAFDRWWSKVRAREPDRFTFSDAELRRADATEVDERDFPEKWLQAERPLTLTYRFEPGADDDGVSVHVPLVALNQLDHAGFDWQVPGHRAELVTALIRSLPKAQRRLVVPAADTARAFLARHGPQDGPLLEVLARFLSQVAGAAIQPSDFDVARVPPHLRVTFVVDDGEGAPLAWGKDLDAVREAVQGDLQRAVVAAAPDLERDDLDGWTIGTLPRVVRRVQGDQTIEGYPALVDEGGRVAVRVLTSPEEQAEAMWAGTRRLLLRSLPSQRRLFDRIATNEIKLALARTSAGTFSEIVDDCTEAAVDHLMRHADAPVWEEAAFLALRDLVRDEIAAVLADAVPVVARIVTAAGRVESRLSALTSPTLSFAASDLRRQIDRLVHRGFVTAAGLEHLEDVERYVRAMERRLDKLAEDPARDRQKAATIQALEAEVDATVRAAGPERRAQAARVRWLLEELRVSTFAQVLGTRVSVSEQRIRKELARLRSG